MTYVLIGTDGQLHLRIGEWAGELGPEGHARVRLHPAWPLAGWVPDCGLLPERYPRNVTGSVLLVALGASRQPYAGPVVITGWHRRREVEPLDERTGTLLRHRHGDVTTALAGRTPPCQADEWAQAARQVAAHIAAAPTPHIRVIASGGLN